MSLAESNKIGNGKEKLAYCHYNKTEWDIRSPYQQHGLPNGAALYSHHECALSGVFAHLDMTMEYNANRIDCEELKDFDILYK